MRERCIYCGNDCGTACRAWQTRARQVRVRLVPDTLPVTEEAERMMDRLLVDVITEAAPFAADFDRDVNALAANLRTAAGLRLAEYYGHCAGIVHASTGRRDEAWASDQGRPAPGWEWAP